MTALQGEVLDMRNVNTSKMTPVFKQCKIKKGNVGREGGGKKLPKILPWL